ncbi:hypothetical protein ACFFJN_15115 [Erwinia mallotivora]
MSSSDNHQKPEKTDKHHPARDNPAEHGEIPRTRDDSEDHKKDPYQDRGK